MKIVIVGLGSIGRRHLRNLVALGEKELLLLRTGKSTLPEQDLLAYPTVTDIKAALDWQPAAVVIANPTALHLETAIPFAEAGCSILLEKPIAHNLNQVNQMQQALLRGGGQIQVGFHFRFHPGLLKLRQLLYENVIGRPLSFRVQWSQYLPDWHPWENFHHSYSARPDLGGGVVLTLCHPLDYMHWLFDQKPDATGIQDIWAFSGMSSDLQIDVEDSAEIGLRFKNGVIGSIHLDYNGQPPEHQLEIIATQGTLRWDNASGAVSVYQAKNKAWQEFPAPPGFERNDLFLAEMEHFLTVVRKETLPICSFEDGLISLKLALAALQSAERGQMITINDKGDLLHAK
jgi:predicted dehydrogenase